MRRTLLLSLVGVGAVVALALGTYSALAGTGPVASMTSAVIGAGEPDDDGDIVKDAEANDVDGDGMEVQEVGDNGEGAQEIAGVIADALGSSQEEVLALHEQGIGLGAIFKLLLLSQTTGEPVEELLAEMTNDGGQARFAFGKRFRDAELSGLSLPADAPRNLGELVRELYRADMDGDDGEAAEAGAGRGRGQGPPEFAKAHGRR